MATNLKLQKAERKLARELKLLKTIDFPLIVQELKSRGVGVFNLGLPFTYMPEETIKSLTPKL